MSTMLQEAVRQSRGRCIACDALLPTTRKPGRKPVVCPKDRDCRRYWHLLYDLGRDRVKENQLRRRHVVDADVHW